MHEIFRQVIILDSVSADSQRTVITDILSPTYLQQTRNLINEYPATSKDKGARRTQFFAYKAKVCKQWEDLPGPLYTDLERILWQLCYACIDEGFGDFKDASKRHEKMLGYQLAKDNLKEEIENLKIKATHHYKKHAASARQPM